MNRIAVAAVLASAGLMAVPAGSSGAVTNFKFGAKLNLQDWKPVELEALYHVGLSFENKDYTPPQIGFLKGSGRWDATTRFFLDASAKASINQGALTPTDLNVKLGMSFVLSRQPTVRTFNQDGTITDEAFHAHVRLVRPRRVRSLDAAQLPALPAAHPDCGSRNLRPADSTEEAQVRADREHEGDAGD